MSVYLDERVQNFITNHQLGHPTNKSLIDVKQMLINDIGTLNTKNASKAVTYCGCNYILGEKGKKMFDSIVSSLGHEFRGDDGLRSFYTIDVAKHVLSKHETVGAITTEFIDTYVKASPKDAIDLPKDNHSDATASEDVITLGVSEFVATRYEDVLKELETVKIELHRALSRVNDIEVVYRKKFIEVQKNYANELASQITSIMSKNQDEVKKYEERIHQLTNTIHNLEGTITQKTRIITNMSVALGEKADNDNVGKWYLYTMPGSPKNLSGVFGKWRLTEEERESIDDENIWYMTKMSDEKYATNLVGVVDLIPLPVNGRKIIVKTGMVGTDLMIRFNDSGAIFTADPRGMKTYKIMTIDDVDQGIAHRVRSVYQPVTLKTGE